MPVTPRGIVTPNDPDNWDLIVDLAAMGSSIDTAIGNSASGRNGTAAQRTAYTVSATNGFLWQDTDGIKMIWRKDGAVWVPAVWRWSGTTTQMNSFAAPNGFEWENLTDFKTYFRTGSGWIPRTQVGNNVLVKAAASPNISYPLTITFPMAFPVVPNVQATASAATVEGLPFVSIWNITATGFQVNMTHNFSTRDLRMNWSATV